MNQGVSLNLKNKFRMSNFTSFNSSPFEMFFNDWQSKISSETVFPQYLPENNDLNKRLEFDSKHVDLDRITNDYNTIIKTLPQSETYKSNQLKKVNKIPEKIKTKPQKQILNNKEKSKIKTNALEDCYSQNNKPLRICRCTYKDLHQEKSIESKSKRNTTNTSNTKQGDFPKIGQSCNIHVKLAYYIFHQQQNSTNARNQSKKAIQNHSTLSYSSQDSIYKSHNFSMANPLMSFSSHRRQDLNMISRYHNLIDPYLVMNYPKQSQKIHFGGFSSKISNDNSLFRTPMAKSIKFPFEMDNLDAEKLMNNFGQQIPHKPSISSSSSSTTTSLNTVNNKLKTSETLPDYRIDTVMKTQYRSRVL